MTKAENSGYEWSKNSRQGTNRQTLVMTEGPTGGRSAGIELVNVIRKGQVRPGLRPLQQFYYVAA